MTKATIHLIHLKPDFSEQFLVDVLNEESTCLIKGVPHGWVHKPHALNADRLLGHDWNMFLLTPAGKDEVVSGRVSAHLAVDVDIPTNQYDQLVQHISRDPRPSDKTPPLPDAWKDPMQIPESEIVETKSGSLGVGELRLDSNMAEWLSTSLPESLRNSPASFFNLFKYKDGDRSTHDEYMEGFKNNFGDAAGAAVKFMGPVESEIRTDGDAADGAKWDDANVVQYDSVWHYAYMLSTDVYKNLNKQKVDGLEDTCILLVSEMELVR